MHLTDQEIDALEALSTGQRGVVRAAARLGISKQTYDALYVGRHGRGCRAATVRRVSEALADLLRSDPGAFAWRRAQAIGA